MPRSAGKAKAAGELVDPLHFFLRSKRRCPTTRCWWWTAATSWPRPATSCARATRCAWLDPGVFGTLGVGGGYALGASLVRPSARGLAFWGDGSQRLQPRRVRHLRAPRPAPIAVIGNDASWAQIARDQVDLLGSDARHRAAAHRLHKVAEGYGGSGSC
jgi:acetolactate synthase-like protein